MYLDRLQEQVDEWTERSDDDPWRDGTTMLRGRLWLTRDEWQEFTEELGAVITKFRRNRTNANHPANTRAVNTVFTAVPAGDPPD